MLINVNQFRIVHLRDLYRRFAKILNAPFQSYIHLKSLICVINLRRCCFAET